MRKIAILALPILNLLSGCTSTEPEPLDVSFSRMSISVDALSTSDALGHRRFHIFPANDTIKSNGVDFQESSLLLAKALEKMGFVLVKNADDADTAIYLDYSLSKPAYSTRDYQGYRAKVAAFTLTATMDAIDQVEYRKSGARSSLWRVQVTAEMPIGSIRMTFPYIVVAGMSYVGKTTDHTEKFYMSVDDRRVSKLISSTFRK
jgi:hypothetical protein